MKKALIFFLVAMAIIVMLLVPSKKEKQKKEEIKNLEPKKKVSDDIIEVDTKDEIKFDFTGNMKILPYNKDDILIFDGKKLVRKDDKFKDIFSARLEVNDFVIKVLGENIYILDKTAKVLYRVSKDGEVVNQAKFAENAKNIYPLENTDVILQYNTSVTTDGIIIFDKDLKQKQHIDYPKAVVNTISYSKNNSNLIVSCQLVSDAEMKNAIYVYNSKYEAVSLNQMKDVVIMNTAVLDKNFILLDPYALYIRDEKFAQVAKIQAHRTFENMLVRDNKIYVEDGPATVRILDSKGTAIEEKTFKQQLSDIIYNSSKTFFVGKDEIYTGAKKITTQKDIQKAILLDNDKVVIFFRNAVKIIDTKE